MIYTKGNNKSINMKEKVKYRKQVTLLKTVYRQGCTLRK